MEDWVVCEVCKENKAKFVVRLEKYLGMDRTIVWDTLFLCSDCAEKKLLKIQTFDFGFDENYEIRAEKDD